MKYMMIWVVLFASCVMAMGEVSKDQLKDLERLVKIDGIHESTDKRNHDKKYAVLKIDYSSEDTGLEEVLIRVTVELTDKDKNTYLVEELGGYGTFPDTYIGEGDWALRMPHGSLERLKITGYAVENGVLDGKRFVPFCGEYEDVKTYDELIARTTTPFPGECKLGGTISVDGN